GARAGTRAGARAGASRLNGEVVRGEGGAAWGDRRELLRPERSVRRNRGRDLAVVDDRERRIVRASDPNGRRPREAATVDGQPGPDGARRRRETVELGRWL